MMCDVNALARSQPSGAEEIGPPMNRHTPIAHDSKTQLAEAPPNDATHPAVVDRLSKDMRATAALLDATDAPSWAADDPWDALSTLRESVEKLSDEAELHRPDVHR